MLSHSCLEELFAGSREGVLLLNGEGKIMWGNMAAGEFLGRPTIDLLGSRFQTLLTESDPVFEPAEEIDRFLQQVSRLSPPVQIPCRIVAGHARQERCLHLTLQHIGLGALAGHLLLRLTDVLPRHPLLGSEEKNVEELDSTENRRLQEIALQAMPLASLGELAAGVAHEINNPANGIINCAQLLFDRLEGRDREIAQRILREGERISVIVRNLLSLARSNQEKNPGVRVEEELTDILSLTRAQMRRERIILILRLAPDLPPVTANSQQIRQVFLNLINNARYALNQKYPGFSEEKVLEIRGEQRPHGVRFIFHDYGIGIPAPILNKIFRPFFTTKPVGRGTGLGLSISHSIIGDHGGTLEIDSVEGQYTRAVIDLPVA